mmetsp:Transcript_1275/g.2889  ORF Transcript_1275/g.2889 Transcript_1275/m.2889 type:complete len:229 (-) Transcript_1275:143-829(-)
MTMGAVWSASASLALASASALSSSTWTPSRTASPSHQACILLSVSSHNGTTPPVLELDPFSPNPAFPSLLTIKTSLASNHATLTPPSFKYAYSVCADQISPKPVTTSITLGGTLRIIRRLCTTDRMSFASFSIRAAMGSAMDGEARERRMESWPERARSSSRSAWVMSWRAESTTRTSWSVMPARAETTAMVGMGPEAVVVVVGESSAEGEGRTRPRDSRMRRSPTVL